MLDISGWVGFSIPGDTLSSRKAYSYRGKINFSCDVKTCLLRYQLSQIQKAKYDKK